MHPFRSPVTDVSWTKSRFILSEWADFPNIDNLSMAVPTFSMRMLTSLSADEILPLLIKIYELVKVNATCVLFHVMQLEFDSDDLTTSLVTRVFLVV